MNKENLNLLSRDKLEELIELQEEIIEVKSSHIELLKNIKIKPVKIWHYVFLLSILLTTIILYKTLGYTHKITKIAIESTISMFIGYTLASILGLKLHNRMIKRIIDNNRIKTPTFEVKFNIGGNVQPVKIIKEDSKEELEQKLKTALGNQEYELAAKYRDELKLKK